MSAKLVLLVDDVLSDGRLVTPVHRLKSISPNWQPNIFDRTVDCYRRYCTDKIKFMPLRDFRSSEPGVKYAYFVPLNDWHWTLQQVYFMIDREKQKLLAEHDVAIYFCQDIEMYPNVSAQFLGDYLGLLKIFQAAHSFSDIRIRIGMCGTLAADQEKSIHDFFAGWLKLVHSPVMIPYSRDAIVEKYAAAGVTIDPAEVMRQYLDTHKERDYLCLNRDPKFSRILMLHALRAYGLLEHGYVSNLFPTQYNVNFKKDVGEFVSRVGNDINIGMIERMEVDKLDSIDVVNALAHNGTAGVLPLDHMARSCYDLVQETTTRYDKPGVVDQGVVTEKTVKSLMFGRPFVVNGGPRVLDIIKRMGFKTCSYLFDESYDHINNIMTRHETIVNNLTKWRGRRQEFMRVVSNNLDNLKHNLDRVKNFPLEDELIKALDL